MNKSDITKDKFMLEKELGKQGYDLMNHIFIGKNEKTEELKTFFISFLAVNPEIDKENVVLLNKIKENKDKKKPAYFMINVGCVGKQSIQLNKYIPFKDVKIDYDEEKGFSINTKNCMCTENKTKGVIEISDEDVANNIAYMSDIGKIEWDLNIDKKIASNMENEKASVFKKSICYHAEGVKTEFDGYIILNDEKYNVIKDECYGMQDKLWGKKMLDTWISLSSNNITSNITNETLKNTVFNLTVDNRNQIITDVYYAGRNLEFITPKITKDNLELKQDEKYIIWNLRQESKKFIINIKICAHKDKMLLMNFENTDGTLKQVLVSGNGFGEVDLYRKEKAKDVIIDSLEVSNTFCRYDNI